MEQRLSRLEFVKNLTDSGLYSEDEIAPSLAAVMGAEDAEPLLASLLESGKLTHYQAVAICERSFDKLVIGNYHVLDRLGAGGMGTVYKARHRRMKRVVAIKVLNRTPGQSLEFVQRFQREVEAVARLSHPNIVMAHDADEAKIGHFLVMEYIDGKDLASVVAERGPLPVAAAVDVVLQTARALEYAHGQGIIHRDIKPANLLRDGTGRIKVTDLGLARFNDATVVEKASLTQAGTIMGTVDFMSPEQAMGAMNIDGRTDIYSLGCTLFYLVNGRPMYQGPTLMAILVQHREAAIPALANNWNRAPAELEAIYRRMVAKKPADRYAAMTEVVRDLGNLMQVVDKLPILPPELAATLHALPTASAGVVAPESEAAKSDRTVNYASPPPTAVVLLVEPSRTQASIIRKYLAELGFHDVVTLLSGASALEHITTTRTTAGNPALVLCAMHLPDMTGRELARNIRNDPALVNTGLVLISSADDEAAAETVPGLVRLHKPFDLERLGQALTKAGIVPPAFPGRVRVLLVEDSPSARKHIRGVLSSVGLSNFTEAADGQEARDLLEKRTFDLIVTDYNMPRLDGRGLLEFIRRQSKIPRVPVILVTTEGDPGKLAAIRELGVEAICDKRCPGEVIEGVLQKLRRA